MGKSWRRPFWLGFCAERGVSVSLLTEHGRFLARVQGPVSGNVLLRREQYRRADDHTASAWLARAFLAAKIINTRWVLVRWLRVSTDHVDAAAVRRVSEMLRQQLDELRRGPRLDVARGIEGRAAQLYFGVFDHLITQQRENIFALRAANDDRLQTRSTPFCPSSIRCSDTIASRRWKELALTRPSGSCTGDRPGRASLALDLMEELRPYLADRLALSLINKRRVRPGGFTKDEAGAVRMDDDTRKLVIRAYQKRKDETLLHPFLRERTTVGMVTHLQALLLAAALKR